MKKLILILLFPVLAFGQINSYQFEDQDALDFIDAAGLQTKLEREYILTLVNRLKTEGFWDGLIAYYPMVGGTADNHKYNLKDPRDNNAAYRLTFGTGTSHDTDGAQGDNTDGNATNTHIQVNDLTSDDNMMSFYSLTDTSPPATGLDRELDMGHNNDHYLGVNFNNTLGYSGNEESGDNSFTAVADTRGHFANNRISGTEYKIFQDGSSIVTHTASSTTQTTSLLYILGANNGNFESDKKFAMASFGDGLSDGDMTSFYNIIEDTQQILCRNFSVVSTTQQKELDGGDWSATNLTITANDTTAPDGTTSAEHLDDLNSTASEDFISDNFAVSSSTNYLFSGFFKFDDATQLRFRIITNNGTTKNDNIFLEDDGTVCNTPSNFNGYEVYDYGDGWYQIKVWYTSPSDTTSMQLRINPSTNSATCGLSNTTTGAVWAWGINVTEY